MRPHGMDCPEDTELKNHSEMPINQDIQPKQMVNIYPGCKLYHRANYIRDKDNSLGEIIVKNFEGKYITCSTRKGEMLFNISALGTFLSLSKDALTDEIVIDGQLDIPLEELANYNCFDNDDKVFFEEKDFFANVRLKLDQKFNVLSGKSNLVKYEFNDFSDSFNKTSFKRYSDYENELVIIGDLLKKPYFGRIDLSENEQQRIYVADRSIPDIGNMIHDWREPICQVYYLDNPVLYNKYGVSLIRNFDIHNGSFCGYFDRYVKNEDDENTKVFDNFLLSILKKRRENEKIQDIIQTIQDTQYEIICDDFTKNLVIQGCAGSGKTMILMHRLSYAIYNRKDLAENSIKIISQNRNLNLELSELAQKLQLNNIDRFTLYEYYHHLIERVFKENRIYEIPNLLDYSSDMCSDNEIADTKLNDIYHIAFGLDCTEFELNKKELEVLENLIQSFTMEKIYFHNSNRNEIVIKYFKHLQSLNILLKKTVRILNHSENYDFTKEVKSRKKPLDKKTKDCHKYFSLIIDKIRKNIEDYDSSKSFFVKE
ncbi:MAG: hypothetical protein EOM42_05235 [Negativicutes bacterium]|nr:hypothetical protein [Negativicutes bacterium]